LFTFARTLRRYHALTPQGKFDWAGKRKDESLMATK
jgi:hypothetical protein